MRIMKKAISFTLVLSLLLALSVSALAADAGYGQYIKLSKEPLDRVHILGTMPAIAGNPEVPIDDTAYLMPDDATLSISLPSGGTYFEGMSMLDFPAGSGDPGWDQPLVNERLYSDGLYHLVLLCRVKDSHFVWSLLWKEKNFLKNFAFCKNKSIFAVQ